ncbi:MAG: hypothetical protein WCC94_08610 [Candidatus Bathyarchaeia archaeon]
MPTQDVLRRLAIVRYLYNSAVRQSRQPEPLGLTSILMFHDSIELFLQLGSEELNVSKQGLGFMDYWSLLEPKLGRELAEKGSLLRLNKARVDFKHYGILPSRLEIESFRASATSFFEANTPLIFGVEFRSVSMLELVQCKEARRSLEEADKMIGEGKIEDALDKIAVAFNQLVDDYEDRKTMTFGQSPFFFGESLTFIGSSFRGMTDLEEFAEKVGSCIEEIQDALKLLSLGLDYRRYAKFRLFTPHITKVYGGTYEILRSGRVKVPPIEDCRFCFDFVIETALHLQEFDFDIRTA